MKMGRRVFAISHATEDTVYAYGYGIYLGEQLVSIGTMRFKTPIIELDRGGTVYGSQCWWCLEEEAKTTIESRKVVVVKLEEKE